MGRRDSRHMLLEAAAAEFRDHGFAGARVARIAERAGVNKQLVFYYFQSKEGIRDAVVADAIGRLPGRRGDDEPDNQDQSTGIHRVRLAISGIFGFFGSNPSALRLALLDARSRTPDGHFGEQLRSQLVRQVERVITDGQGLGFFRDDVEPGETARHGLALILGYCAMYPDLLVEKAIEAREEQAEKVSSLLLRCLSW